MFFNKFMDDHTQNIPVPPHERSSAVWSITILAWSLAIVLFYFGLGEVLSPQEWTSFAPTFLGTGNLVIAMVIAHGVLLCAAGMAFVLNYRRKNSIRSRCVAAA